MRAVLMCGIFAYSGDRPPDAGLLTEAAQEAARRGPHGYGWVARGEGWESTHWRLGALNGEAKLLARLAERGARLLLGHARLATQGAACDDPAGLQPVGRGEHYLAHNGNVYNPAELAATESVAAETDSAALAAAYAAARSEGWKPAEALAGVTARAAMPSSAVVVLDASGTLLAWRRRLPLFVLDMGCRSIYVGSRPFAGAQLLPEESVIVWANPSGRLGFPVPA